MDPWKLSVLLGAALSWEEAVAATATVPFVAGLLSVMWWWYLPNHFEGQLVASGQLVTHALLLLCALLLLRAPLLLCVLLLCVLLLLRAPLLLCALLLMRAPLLFCAPLWLCSLLLFCKLLLFRASLWRGLKLLRGLLLLRGLRGLRLLRGLAAAAPVPSPNRNGISSAAEVSGPLALASLLHRPPAPPWHPHDRGPGCCPLGSLLWYSSRKSPSSPSFAGLPPRPVPWNFPRFPHVYPGGGRLSWPLVLL